MKKLFGGPTFLLVVTMLSLALFLPALQSGIGGGGQSNVSGGGGVTFPLLAPNGTAAAPSYAFSSQPTTGWYINGLPTPVFEQSGTDVFRVQSTGNAGIILASNMGLAWTTNVASLNADTGLCRNGSGIVTFGNGSCPDTSSKVQAAGYMSLGTTFTASGCGNTTLVGGATAGKYTSVTAGACTVTITMGNSATAPNAWACDAHDITTVADANNVTLGASTTTTANLVEGTVAANDVIVFKCMGY